MRVLRNRRAVIEWAGDKHAFPVRKEDAPSDVKLVREDEPGFVRVGWREFFAPLDREERLVAVDETADFSVRVLSAEEARRTLPPEAFGPPWWQRLLHEIWLDRPQPKAA